MAGRGENGSVCISHPVWYLEVSTGSKKHLMESTWLKLSASYCNPSTVSGSIPGKKVEQKWVILKILLIYIYLGFLEIAV